MKTFCSVVALLVVLLYLPVARAFAQSTITTVVGGLHPFNGGSAIDLSFSSPNFVISDRSGGFYFSVGDTQHRVYHVTANGTVTIIAGNGTAGFGGDGGPAASARLNNPSSLALDAAGNLLIADRNSHRIRKVTPGGVISTIAGMGAPGYGGDGGQATSALLNSPNGIAVDGDGNLLIVDSSNHRIRRVTPAGFISTVAGIGTRGFSGDGGPALSAQLQFPIAITADASGNLFISDYGNARIRKVTPNGVITTVAGSGTSTLRLGDDGPALSARMIPYGITLDASGNLLIADAQNRVRKVNSAGIITTVAGTGDYGFAGENSEAIHATLAQSLSVAIDAGGNLLIADTDNYRVRRVDLSGVITTVAGNGSYGFNGDNRPANSALLNFPAGISVDSEGNLLIADVKNHRIRKVSPGGTISTVAGNGVQGYGGDGGLATAAHLDNPAGIAVAPDGTIYISDCNSAVRKVTPAGFISTAAARGWNFCGVYSYYYDGYFYYSDKTPRGAVALDPAGNLFIADTFGHRIFKATLSGDIIVVAGSGIDGFSGDGGLATSAHLSEPSGIAIDGHGNVFIADTNNNRIRKVTPAGIITTIAGNGNLDFAGDGGPASSASLYQPTAIALDSVGNLFIADTSNNRIRKLTPAGIITTVAGTGSVGSGGDGGPATAAQLYFPTGIAVNADDDLFIADTQNHSIRKVEFALEAPTLNRISTNYAGQGVTLDITLSGTSFTSPLNIDAGSGIAVSNVNVLSKTRATATLTIAPDASIAMRNVVIETGLGKSGGVPFSVVGPYPDLSISSSQAGELEVGFNSTTTLSITNRGLVPTTGPITVTDTLPAGLTFVSATGSGWSCSSTLPTVTCNNSQSLASGGTTTLTMAIAVDAGGTPQVTHSPTVAVDGESIPFDNTVSVSSSVMSPEVFFQFSPSVPVAGSQDIVGLTLLNSLSHDVSGTLTVAFSSDAIIPTDDPAIQFSSGGRSVSFLIPANSLQARFGSNLQSSPIAYQSGTVAGTLTFRVTLQSGAFQTSFSNVRTLPRQAPTIHSVQKEADGLRINLSSTMREVTQLSLSFATSPSVLPSCGAAAGCVATGNTLLLDIKSLVDTWYRGDSRFGSLASLRLPLSIQGIVRGGLQVSLRNSMGVSNTVSVPLP